MKKLLSILLVAIMLFTMVPASVFAADGITVKLVSFMRGNVTDLRSSELLEVRVEGYDGNPRELTYKWTSSLGTYLYIYNSHNMYGINNSYGEMEIYNTDKSIKRSENVEADRAGDKTLSKQGFMWASVYGAYTYGGGSASSALKGTVTVEVFDKNGNSLGSDSFSSFKAHNLDGDLDNVVIGLFEGDRMNALDLLGQSGIVHITCTSSSVSSAEILEGDEHIAIETEKKDKNTYNYFIKGVKAGDNSTNGDAQLEINIKKTSCKFHYNTSGTAEPIVYVFKKPKTSTTTTTLTLVSDIDSRCTYFINGVEGTKQNDGTIIFTGLNPNTTYTVEVRAEYKDGDETKYVYGYVDDTTKPVYKATVKTYLDNNLVNVAAIHGAEVKLYLSKDNVASNFIELENKGTGIYEAVVENGTYFPWHYENGGYHQARKYELIVENANAELRLHHYSVKYDTNGGAFKSGEEVGTEIYSSMSAVNATSNIPVRDGYVFAGWEYDKATYASGALVTSSITAPITLKAKWEKEVNVTINVTINHEFNINGEPGVDPNPNRSELVVDFLEMKEGTPAFVETGDKLHFTEDIVTDEKGNAKAYDYAFVDEHISTYKAHDYTYTGLLETSAFGVAVSKSGYDVESVTKAQDVDGNWTIDIKLICNPDDFDVDFSVEMADDVPEDLYPDAVIVKIAYWNTETNEWKIISQQETVGAVVKPGVRVDIDPETGKGAGSYPVWRFDGDGEAYGYRAVVTGFIYGDSTIIVPTEKDHIKDDNTVIVTYTDGNYTATMSDIADGKKFSTSLNGAYYNDQTKAQQGTLHGVITVEKYDVIFDANGGTNAEGKEAAKQVYRVPELDDYKPTMEDHTFLGWYKDKECTIPAVEDELLTCDITLYAKWDQILTGSVRVAGSYLQDGHLVNVWDIDRTNSAVVVLQEITSNGVYNIDRQTVKVVWPMSEMIYGISEEYKFTGLDPSKQYRTEVVVLNYGTTYQNSTTMTDNDGEYADDYNTTDFEAIYPEDSNLETFVNAYLSFEPDSYFQPVEVDATLIGANSRPNDTLVQVWYKATGTDNDYQVISQHTVVPYGIEIGMGADGMDDSYYGYVIWNSLYNGNLYDYQAYLDKIEGENVSEWPVSVVYGAPSRYSPINNAATGVLQVKLVPNRYGIIFNENYVNEGINVVSYGKHTWSYETIIDYVPVREGYVFQGWYSTPDCTGEKVTKIAETVAADTNLYAKWEAETGKELTVYHVEKDTNILLETETKECSFDQVVTAESLKKDFTGFIYDSASPESVKITTDKNEITLYYVRNNYGYTVNYLEEETDKVLADAKSATALYGASVTETAIEIDGYTSVNDHSKTITIDTENNVINFYYAADNFGGEDGEESDGTPDKYQKKIIFKIVNGMWSNGTTEDIIQFVTLVKDGKYSIDGTATIKAPTGMISKTGYKNGAWDKVVPEIVSGTETLVYTYEYLLSTTPVEPTDYVGYIVKHYLEGSDGVYYSVESDTEYYTGHVGDTVTATAKTYDGYCLNNLLSKESASGVLKAISGEGDILTLKLYYEIDNLGGENGDESDGTADKYQKKVIFKVVNGTWADGTTADKVVYLDLMKNGNYSVEGTATLTAPTGMKAYSGFTAGKWDVAPPSSVSGTATETYTYRFEEKQPGYVVEIPEKVTVYEEGTTDIVVEIIPNEGTDESEIPEVKSYESTDESIATVDQNGKVTGIKEGTTTVIVTFTDGTQKTVTVVVKEREGIHVVFGKTDGIGWYRVSRDGGKTFETVFGNSTLEVKQGTQLIINVGDVMGDTFVFYVNGDKVYPDENGNLVVTVNSYMLIGALSVVPEIDFEVPDPEESLNWFQRIIKAIKDFFARIFGKK